MADGSSFRRKLSARRIYEVLLERHETALAEAFMEAVRNLRSGVQIQRLERALAAGDIEAALAALNLDDAAFDQMLEEIRAAYMDSGRTTSESISRAVRIRFNGRNPRAEAWLASHSSDLITRMSSDQKKAIRAALTSGMERGAAPRATALEIAGRVNRVTGRREGGIIGLTSSQADQVERARRELASAKPNDLNHYLTRKARDKRFDRSIQKAVRTGTPLPAEQAARAVAAYEQRLLRVRATTIARTEAMSAMAEAAYEAYRQAIEDGRVDARDISKTWRSASDARVRHSHRVLNGQKIGFYDRFASPSGARMRFPMDTSGGATVADIANCRCIVEYRIDLFGEMRRRGS